MGVEGTPAPAGQETGAGLGEITKIDNRQAQQPDAEQEQEDSPSQSVLNPTSQSKI